MHKYPPPCTFDGSVESADGCRKDFETMADNIYRRYRHGRGYIFCFYVGNRISSLTSVSHFFFLFFFSFFSLFLFLSFFNFHSRTCSFLFLSFRFRFYMVPRCPIVSRMYVCLIPKGPRTITENDRQTYVYCQYLKVLDITVRVKRPSESYFLTHFNTFLFLLFFFVCSCTLQQDD